jgi:hypothetical protein
MAQTVFFSWQSDTPYANGRNFIRAALDQACKNIAADTTIDESVRELEADSDTQGVAGQPPIVDTIFKKIDAAAVFLADMTFTGTRPNGKGPVPNPNVLIEYGWAVKSLQHNRVIYLVNAAYGEPSRDNLPFDLAHLRWPITYNLFEDAAPEARVKEKEKLTAILEKAIRTSLKTLPPVVIPPVSGFVKKITEDGPARFRKPGEAIGLYDDFGDRSLEVHLSSGPALWLRIMPAHELGKTFSFQDLRNKRKNNALFVKPLFDGGGSYGDVQAIDGMGVYKGKPQDQRSKTIASDSIAFVFKTGEIWSIDAYRLTAKKNDIPFLEEVFSSHLEGYVELLQSLDLKFPFRWIAGMTGVKGRHLYVPPPPKHMNIGDGPTCFAETIETEGLYVEGQTATEALMPFFKEIYESCGVSRPDYLPQK